ncbi:MAG: histidine phosphatase family protein [Polyangiaceae bacterium]|nr:histidine phosphatase family protein [Polyangiaceae bacterium]
MELLIVRHGESTGNAEGRMQGRQDWPLSERGREQARGLGEFLGARGVTLAAVYSSPLSRALETARIVAARAGAPEPVTEPELAEIDAGGLEGLDRAGMEERFPEFLRRDITTLGDFGAFGGEGYEAVQARIQRMRERLEARHREAGDRVMLVAHGGINFQLVKSLICVPVPRVCILRFGNCSATLVVMRERRGTWLGEIAWHLPIELVGGSSGDGTAALFR